MKGKMIGCLLLVFTACLWVQGSTSKAAGIDSWDITKEYTTEENSIRYHVYLSKDRKESWIYQMELLDDYKVLDIVIPEKMQGAAVTCLGVTSDLHSVWNEKEIQEACFSLFNVALEPWHDYEGPDARIYNVRSVVMPDTVEELGSAAFACMVNLRYVHISSKITTLNRYTFYACRDLQKIECRAEVELPDGTVFQYCDGLKGLMEESEFNRLGMTMVYKDNMIFNKEAKRLIQVMPSAKKITLPAYVKEIEPSAFTNSSLQTVKVAKKNKYFAVQGRCLYEKKNGKLILAFGKGSKLTLPKKIKKLSRDTRVTRYTIKKLVMPKKLKRGSGWKKVFTANNSKIKIYYRGKQIH